MFKFLPHYRLAILAILILAGVQLGTAVARAETVYQFGVVPQFELRWSHLVGQFGGLFEVYSAV